MIREGSGDPLVLLHCLGVDHRCRDFAKPLGAQRTLWRYDLHPATARPRCRRRATRSRICPPSFAALMQREGIARADIAEHNPGGLIAQHFAATHPDKVSKPAFSSIRRRAIPTICARCGRNAPQRATTAASPRWSTACCTSGSRADAIRADIEAFAMCARLCGARRHRALACEALAAADLRDLAAAIRAPTLVVCGDNDIPLTSSTPRAGSPTRSPAPARRGSQARGMPPCWRSRTRPCTPARRIPGFDIERSLQSAAACAMSHVDRHPPTCVGTVRWRVCLLSEHRAAQPIARSRRARGTHLHSFVCNLE